MTSSEIRSRFLEFFEKHGHTIVPSSSLIPENDLSVLFTTAGMQQFKSYFTNDKDAVKDFKSKNTVSVQKCIRTSDIDEVGDETHLTFFEMLGNFSFGGYGKKEAIRYAWDFITKELGIESGRIHVTIFDGKPLGRDDESYSIWKDEIGLPPEKIKIGGIDDNFWGPTGNSGPCGPTTEIYIDGVEIWNIVFNQYFSKTSREEAYRLGWQLSSLAKLGIDTGMGLERLVVKVTGVNNVYETDLFKPLLDKLKNDKNLHNYEESSARIILDHARAATFLIADGVVPSSDDRGYVLRRLIRRAVDGLRELNIKPEDIALSEISHDFINMYLHDYPYLLDMHVEGILSLEINGYVSALRKGIQKIIQTPDLPLFSLEGQSKFIFNLYQSEGLPVTVAFAEIHKHYALTISDELKAMISRLVDEHQSLSRTGAEKKFKGGLADPNDEMVVRYHTATHLLHQALRDVLGNRVEQKGSNITAERLRFDFSFARKVTDEEKKKVEDIVDQKIAEALPMNNVTLPRAEAEKTGALHFFGEKYGEQVSVYFIGKDLQTAYSKEFCGGPHVKNTAELAGPEGKWRFKIVKEEAVSQGVRRIKAVLE